MHQTRTIVVAVAVLAATVTAAVPASADDVFTIDSDHGLASDGAVAEYHDEGYVTTRLVAPDLRITIAAEHEDVGVGGVRSDVAYHYLRLRYNETLPAEFRVYIPAGYWTPHPQNLDSITTDDTLRMRRTPSGNYSTLTVEFDGPADAVFAVPVTADLIFGLQDHERDFVENHTDYEVPRLGSTKGWNYIEQRRLVGNSTPGIERHPEKALTIQYEASDDRWIAVPDCDAVKDGGAPVCTFTRRGASDVVYLLSKTTDPPTVRYKYEAGALSGLASVGDGIAVTIENIMRMVGGLFGGG